jgi:hypothetical protein
LAGEKAAICVVEWGERPRVRKCCVEGKQRERRRQHTRIGVPLLPLRADVAAPCVVAVSLHSPLATRCPCLYFFLYTVIMHVRVALAVKNIIDVM